jgi:hypothetical protein
MPMGDNVGGRPSEELTLRELLSDAIRYWEPRRWLYNAALAAVVLLCFAIQLPSAWTRLTFQIVLWVFIDAVLANIAYCAAYPVDVVLQYSSLRPVWCKRRWYLLVIGTLFGCAITYLFASTMFLPPYDIQ